MHHKLFHRCICFVFMLALAFAGVTPALAAPPTNDNFADAEGISAVPFSVAVDITEATFEEDEPQYCEFMPHTVWYSFTPTELMVVVAHMQGSAIPGNLNVYRAAGPGLSGLEVLGCSFYDGPVDFLAEPGQVYYLQAGPAFGNVGTVQVNLDLLPAPENDDLANATSIDALDFSTNLDTTGATFESGEPAGSCASNSPPYRTVWFSFTPVQDGPLSAGLNSFSWSHFLTVYQGTSLNDLTELGCQLYYDKFTFSASAGETYYFQVGGLEGGGGTANFYLQNTPPPQVNFFYFPGDPSKYDLIQFVEQSNDPGGIGFESYEWDFGDGAASIDPNPTHQYAADGDYLVYHSVTTPDGRTASTTTLVSVRTHDVGITKIAAPKSANSGQTREITVSVRNTLQPETVRIDLYRSMSGGGFELIGTSSQYVPVRTGTRTTQFVFNYTFSPQDALMGKVVFKAIATMNHRDALPADNVMISPPTTVPK